MATLKEQYDETALLRKSIIEEIKMLEESDVIKRYLDLTSQNERLYNRQCTLLKTINQTLKEEEYDNCNHVLVCTKVDYDQYAGHTCERRGCIKCGLNESVLSSDGEYLSFSDKVMYTYLKRHSLKGFDTMIACDLELAHAIYSKIKQANPDIDDIEAVSYLETALDDIRKIKVSDERKASRVKRLSLNPDFKKWHAIDIHSE